MYHSIRSRAPFATIAFATIVSFALASGCSDRGESTYVTPANSMAPTISRGDRVTVDKTSYSSAKDIQRWDIVVFRYKPRYQEPTVSDQGERVQSFVKRVVALPGEELTYSESGVLIDGKPLEIPLRLKFLGTFYSSEIPELDDIAEVSIPADSVFLLGDNIDHSRDSRIFGPVAFDDLVGKVIEVNGKLTD